MNKRVVSFVLICLLLVTSLPTEILGMSHVHAEGMDLTTEASDGSNKVKREDLTMSLAESDSKAGIAYSTKTDEDTQIKLSSSDATDGIYKIPEGVSFNSLKYLFVNFKFSIADPDIRDLEAGDYIVFEAPEGMAFAETPADITPRQGSGVIATFERSSDNKVLKMVFSTAVPKEEYYTNLVGEFGLKYEITDESVFTSEKTLALFSGLPGGISASISIPAKNDKVSGVKKEGKENTDINGADWTITVGSDSKVYGTSLAGVTVTDTFSASEMAYYAAGGATLNGESIEMNLSKNEDSDEYTVSYTFPSDTTAVAPATIAFQTVYTDDLIKQATAAKANGETAIEVSNHVTISGDTVDTSATDNEDTATATVSVTTVQKSAKQIDGNTMEWTLILNEENHRVWNAIVKDTLMEGLTVDESYGIHISDDTQGSSVVLSGAGEDNKQVLEGINVYYTDAYDATDAEGNSVSNKQNVKIHFGNDFRDQYTIVFRTKVASDFSKSGELTSESEDGTSSTDVADGGEKNIIDNQATVSVSYPSGGTGGTYIEYEDTTVRAVFVSAYLTVEADGEPDTKTGLLKWIAKPSSKSGFDTAKIKLFVGEDQSLTSEVPYITYGNNKTLSSQYYSYDADTKTITITKQNLLDATETANRDETFTLSDFTIHYETVGDSYYKDDEKHTYSQKGTIEVSSAATDTAEATTYSYTSKEAKQTLQNQLLSKKVETVYDDTNNDAYFHFTITVNKNQMSLTNVKIQDDLTNCLKYIVNETADMDGEYSSDGASKVDSSWFTLMGNEASGDYASYIKVGDEKKTLDINTNGENRIVSYETDALSESAVLHIYMKLTDEGKAAMRLQNNKQLVVFADNTVSLTAAELKTDSGNIQKQVVGLSDGQVMESQVVYKEGKQGSTADTEANIYWSIKINNAFTETGSGQTIIDTIPAGITLKRDSIKLYKGKHSGQSSVITADKDNEFTGVENGTAGEDQFAYTITVNRNGKTVINISLPTSSADGKLDTESLVLQYTTAINESTGETYENSYIYGSGDASCSGSASVKTNAFSWGDGYPMVLYQLKKYDSLSTSVNTIPVVGAHYGLYSDAECTKLVAEGFTDSNGELTLMANRYEDGTVDTPATYYVKELQSTALEDGQEVTANDISYYQVDTETVYGPYKTERPGRCSMTPIVYNADSQTGTPEGSYFTDTRKTDESTLGTATLTKEFVYDADGQDVTGLTSEFRLYVYPQMETSQNGTYKKLITVSKEADGTYKYTGAVSDSSTSEDTVMTTTESTQTSGGDNGKSTLTIKDLPWGTYYFQEKTAPDGFLLSDKTVVFRVDANGETTYKPEDVSNTAFSSYETLTSQNTDLNTVTDSQTEVQIVKTGENGNLNDFSNVSFTIKPVDDGETFVGPNSDKTEITLNGSESTTDGILGTLIGSLKTGVKYTVSESAESIPYGYGKVKNFTFSIGKNSGKVVLDGTTSNVTCAGNKITVSEPLTKLSVQKKDQNGDLITGINLKIVDEATTGNYGFAELDSNGIPTGNILEEKELTYTTGDAAWNITGQLLSGHTYRIYETNTVDGYVPANEEAYYVKVSVGNNGTITAFASKTDDQVMTVSATGTDITIKNLKIQADVQVRKQSSLKESDGTAVPLSDVTYDLYKDAGLTDKYASYKTGADGTFTIRNLSEGTYYLKESQALTNYILDDAVYTVSVTEDDIDKTTGKNKTVVVKDGENSYLTNTPVPVSIVIKDGGIGSSYKIYDVTDGDKTEIGNVTLLPGENEKTFSEDNDGNTLTWQKKYQIQQVSVSDGYIVDNNPHEIDAFDVLVRDIPNKDSVATETFTNDVTAVTFYKVDQNNEPVEGARFTLSPVGDAKIVTEACTSDITVDENGNLTWTSGVANGVSVGKELKGVLTTGGTYTITETETPDDYLSAAGNEITLKVKENGVITVTDSDTSDVLSATCEDNKVTLHNKKIFADVTLTKVDETRTEKKLKGAKFNLYQMVGETADTDTDLLIGSYETGDDGTITVESLKRGNYYFEEVEAPNSYLIISEDNHYAFTVDADNDGEKIELTAKNRRISGSITITKTGKGTTVDGAEYTLYQYDDEAEEYKPVKVDGEKYSLTVSNAVMDSHNVYSGSVTFSDLDWGTYYVKETKAPDGYTLDRQMHGAYEIKEDVLSVSSEVSDEVTDLSFELIGVLSENDGTEETEPLGDIDVTILGPMNLKDSDGNQITEKTYKTDSDGHIKVENTFIVGNDYTVKAVDPENHYNVIESYRFHVSEDGTMELIDGSYNSTKVSKKDSKTIKMKARKTLFFLELTDTQSKGLSDGTLAIFEERDGEISDTPVDETVYTTQTDAEGNAVDVKVEGLLPGDYVLKQTETPDGYVPADPIAFTLHADNTIEINDSAETLGRSESVDPKDAATIVMQDYKTQLNIKTLITPYESVSEDADKTESLDGVSVKIYTDRALSRELTLEDDSVLNMPKTSQDMTSDSDNQVTLVSEGINDQDDGALRYVKNGDGSTWIQGLTMNQVYYIQVSGILDGENVKLNTKTYVVKVGENPEEIAWAELTSDGSDTELTTSDELTIINDVYRGDVVLTKTDKDDTDKVLAGSVYGLYKKESTAVGDYIGVSESEVNASAIRFAGAPAIIHLFSFLTDTKTSSDDNWVKIAEATTDADGKITFSGLVAGVEYQIREIDEPDGYQVSKNPITIRLNREADSDGNVTGTSFEVLDNGDGTAKMDPDGNVTWYEPRVKVEFNKLNDAGEHLAGATLQVIDKDTNQVVASWTSDGQDGYLITGVLAAGKTYIYREVSAPDGYVIAEDVEFEVEAVKLAANEDYIQQVTMIDYKTKKEETAAEEKLPTLVGGYREEYTEEDAKTSASTDSVSNSEQQIVSPHTGDDSWFSKILELFQ